MPTLSTALNVSLAGSGQLYPGYIGVLWCLKDNGIEIAEISTTSGGAVIGGAVTSGYDAGPDLVKLAKDTLPLRNGLFDPGLTAWRNWGLISGDKIEAKFKELLTPTFGQTSLPLYVTSANVSKRKRELFSTSSTPDMSLSKAVRMSIGLPLVFAPVRHNGDLYVDGGIALNVPTTVFTNGLPVLSVSFDRADPIRKFLHYVSAVVNTLLDSASAGAENVNHLQIDVGYSGFNYFIGPDDVDRMVETSYHATERWLENEAGKGAV